MTTPAKAQAYKWINFVRNYGPIASNDSAFEEHTQRVARRAGVKPFEFEHPFLSQILPFFTGNTLGFCSVILTGEAGDGKTHLCRKIWLQIGGTEEDWDKSESYLRLTLQDNRTLHLLRDLSDWVPLASEKWPPEKEKLLHKFSDVIFQSQAQDLFLIAVNDGQLIETWKRLSETDNVIKARALFEELLVEEHSERPGTFLKFFNLSRSSSAKLLDRVLVAFLQHPGWDYCFSGEAASLPEFGPNSPIRRNFELLQQQILQTRLRNLLELCDYNGLHIPIREILALLSNAILGHPRCKDGLMTAADVETIINQKTVSKASIYNNLFGGNLRESRSEAISVFQFLKRFRIGYETNNRIDNILIFGETDDTYRSFFDQWIGSDTFYGADNEYHKNQSEYLEGGEENGAATDAFIESLIALRRALFFKIPDGEQEKNNIWRLSAFSFAGEYLKRIVAHVQKGIPVERDLVNRIVLGLNRIFTGMLISSRDKLYLGTSSYFTNSKIAHFLEDEIKVKLKSGEKIEITEENNKPILRVQLSPNLDCKLELNLVRYEFLSRVATGALPGSFSKECYEDILSFKGKLLSLLQKRKSEEEDNDDELRFHPLKLDASGSPLTGDIEIVLLN